MTDGHLDQSASQADAVLVSQPASEIKQHMAAITTHRSTTETLVAEITGQSSLAATKAGEIEQLRVAAEKAKADIEARMTEIQTAVTTANQQAESVRTIVVELTALASTVQGTSRQALDTVTQANAALESARTLAASATESSGRIEAIKTQVEQAAQVAATRSQHIEDGRKYVDDKRAEIDVILNAAKQAASNTEAEHQVSRAASANANTMLTAVQAAKAASDSNAAAIAAQLAECTQHTAATKSLADKADTTDRRIAEYETRLAALEATAQERLKTIESLLPGAASAGLASAFNMRRTHFRWPTVIWQAVFILCLVGLLGIAGLEFSLFSKDVAALTWERLGLSLLHRLPFALPLIWLACYASDKASLAQRVEEDYAFKETVSRSFEGYRREMSELEGKAAPNSALSRLCSGVLGVITSPPGRIYEKHPLSNTPLSALSESAAPVAEAVTAVAKTQRLG